MHMGVRVCMRGVHAREAPPGVHLADFARRGCTRAHTLHGAHGVRRRERPTFFVVSRGLRLPGFDDGERPLFDSSLACEAGEAASSCRS